MVRKIWAEIPEVAAGRRFVNLEGGGVEQQPDRRLRLHHCANYAAALSILSTAERNINVLELGCGSGALSRAFARTMPSGWKLVATDYSRRLIDYARENHTLPNLIFAALDAARITPGLLADIDAVMFLEVIEHLPRCQVAELFSCLYQGLGPGGTVIISTVDRSPFVRPFSGYPHHQTEYRYETLQKFLQDRRINPFEEVTIFRVVSPRIVRAAIRAENRGGYFLNRLAGLVGRLIRPAQLTRSQERLSVLLSFLYRQIVPRRRFAIDDYLTDMALVTVNAEKYNQSSFSLIAVLRKGGGGG